VQELPSATALWLVNAVRGWVPITLVEPPGQPA
jgi:branched-subunit amino acid aminotransferase/4-amino-4-deoxychorismate lyase